MGGAAFAAIALRYEDPLVLAGLCIFAAVLIAEALIDLDTRKLKDLTTGQEHDIVATDASIETMKRGGFLGYVKERLRQRLNAQPPRAP